MYVVAGATGRVGSVAASALLEHGDQVKVLVRDERKGADWSRRGAEVAQVSLDDTSALVRALRGVKGAFFLLPADYAATDFYGHQRALSESIARAIQEAQVPRIVLLSSVGADLSDGTGPIKGLHYFENAVRATGVQLTIARASYFQENVGDMIASARSTGVYSNYLPSQYTAFPTVSARDVGSFVGDALHHSPGTIEVVDLQGPAYSVHQLADALGKRLHKALTIVDIPPHAHVHALTRAGVPQPIAEALAEMYAAYTSGLVSPKGDRLRQCRTTIDETLSVLLPA